MRKFSVYSTDGSGSLPLGTLENISNQSYTHPPIPRLLFVLLLTLIVLIYSNSFKAGWHFDDYHVILNNPKIQIQDLTLPSFFKTFYSHPTKDRLYRPVSNLTIAINWYYGKDNTTGYHVVNLAIHFLAAYVLFLTVLNLFYTPNLEGQYNGWKYFIAMLSAVLWAIHPVQTQTVTYIVQRMAALAGLFYILGLFFFLKARLSNHHSMRWLYSLCCGIAFLFAIGSKLNAVTFPIILIVIELVFFRRIGLKKLAKNVRITRISAAIGITGGICIPLLVIFFPPFLDSLYSNVAFTPTDRLFTQSRVLVFYISQIIYPVPSRLSLIHDIPISHTLTTPLTTIPSSIAIFSLLVLGVYILKKNRFFGFAILFFLIAHSVESTILPLAFANEHRNYLPSMFLFPVVAIWIKTGLSDYCNASKGVYAVMLIGVTGLIIWMGTCTYLRNTAWATEKSLWEDAKAKAPQSAMPYHYLAWAHYAKAGQLDKALALYKQSLAAESPWPNFRSRLYDHLSQIYAEKRMFDKAIECSKQALAITPGYARAMYHMSVYFLKTGEFDEALVNISLLSQFLPDVAKYQTIQALILLHQDKAGQAIHLLNQTKQMDPSNPLIYLYLGIAHSKEKRYHTAEEFYEKADALVPNDLFVMLAKTENQIHSGDNSSIDHFINQFIDRTGFNQVPEKISQLRYDNLNPPLDYHLIIPHIIQSIRERGEKIKKSLSKLPEKS